MGIYAICEWQALIEVHNVQQSFFWTVWKKVKALKGDISNSTGADYCLSTTLEILQNDIMSVINAIKSVTSEMKWSINQDRMTFSIAYFRDERIVVMRFEYSVVILISHT